MTSEVQPAPLSRILKVDEIKDGASGEIVATPAEMDAIAGLLDLVRLEGPTLDCRFTHGGSGRLRLTGRLKADVTQTCVVSLDPVEARIDVPLEVEFWQDAVGDRGEQRRIAGQRVGARWAGADRLWADRSWGRGV
jgi:hypothetical protein